jgi:hypothetical protein
MCLSGKWKQAREASLITLKLFSRSDLDNTFVLCLYLALSPLPSLLRNIIASLSGKAVVGRLPSCIE